MSSLISYGSNTYLPDDPGFSNFFNYLLQTKTAVDVIFILETTEGEIEICSHKMILAMRSPTFEDMFYSNGKLKECQAVRLRNINHKAFTCMIRYCYGCKPALRIIEEVCELLKVAYEFKVMPLVDLCVSFLRNTKIEPGNVFAMLEASEKIEDMSLRDKCSKVLEEKTREVLDSYKLCDITSTMVYSLIRLPKLSLCSEHELIKWVFNWKTVKSEEKDCNSENVIECFQSMLQYLNFFSLTFEEFAELCTDYPDFLSSHEIASIFLNIAFPGSREMPGWCDKKLRFRIYSGLKKS